MALLKTLPQYQDASYWRILGKEVCFDGGWANILVQGWLSAGSRSAQEPAIITATYPINGDDFDFTDEALPLDEVYAKMKIVGEWAGAEDA